MLSYLVLLRAVFAGPAGHPAAGGLLPHHFTLTRPRLSGDQRGLAVLFLWHFPSGRPDWVLPSALLFGARTFLQPFTRSAVTRPPRPDVILPAGWGLLNLGVQCHVGELVGAAFALPLHVVDGNLSELLQELGRLPVKGFQMGFLDLVLSFDLLHDQFRVQVDLQAIRFPLRHRLEPVDQSVILGFVVGGLADEAMKCPQPDPLVVFDDHTDGGKARVASGRAVCAQAKDPLQASTRIRLQCSHWTRSSSPFRNTCIPEEVTVTRQAVHWLLSTLATAGWARVRE